MIFPKGPWKALWAVQSNGPNYIAITDGTWGAPSIAHVFNVRAGDLIAAAPEMLEALKRCLKDDAENLEVETVHLAMEAIAKAEGRV